MENTDRRTAVDLITGFLGAGKTTFIRRYAAYLEERGIAFAVIENEFGAAGVDARMLGGNVRELAGGCICCGQKVNFHNLLIELAGQADRIIVEPSGVFNADDFFDIMDSPKVQAVAKCGVMAGVVDPCSLDSISAADEEIFFSEMISSGVILLSHTDQADGAQIEAAKARIQRILGTLPEIMDARTAPLGALMHCTPVRREHVRMREDHSRLFQCASFVPDGVYSEESLRRLAEALFSGETGNVLRVKGAFRAEQGLLMLNATIGSAEITPVGGDAVLNVIGHGLKRKAIRQMLSECVRPDMDSEENSSCIS